MIAAYSAHRPDSVTAALGIHLIVYCSVGACLAFGLYALLQPSRAPNSGLAGMNLGPERWSSMTSRPWRQRSRSRLRLSSSRLQPAAFIDPEPATTGRSTPEPELKPTIAAPPSQPRTAKRPNREVRIDSPKRRGAACIPGYDSSGAQIRPCG